MTTLVLRGMLERRLRSVLTAVAVVLGVAMIAGTYVQTDAINNAFAAIEDTAYKGVAAVITPRTAFRSQFAEPKPFSAALVGHIRALHDVSRAEGQLGESGQLVVRGKPVNNTFAPSLVISNVGALFNQVRVVRGRFPRAQGEVVIDEQTSSRQRVSPGEVVGVAARLGMQRVRVVGTVSFGGGTSIGGATLIYAPLADVQRWYGAQGQVTTVLVSAAAGVSPTRLVSEIRRLLPANLEVRTGQAQASKETKESRM
jgi:putative ABC transport system permease protein